MGFVTKSHFFSTVSFLGNQCTFPLALPFFSPSFFHTIRPHRFHSRVVSTQTQCYRLMYHVLTSMPLFSFPRSTREPRQVCQKVAVGSRTHTWATLPAKWLFLEPPRDEETCCFRAPLTSSCRSILPSCGRAPSRRRRRLRWPCSRCRLRRCRAGARTWRTGRRRSDRTVYN
jgi:hypothetical protein